MYTVTKQKKKKIAHDKIIGNYYWRVFKSRLNFFSIIHKTVENFKNVHQNVLLRTLFFYHFLFDDYLSNPSSRNRVQRQKNTDTHTHK
jgi:hypothetical protein